MMADSPSPAGGGEYVDAFPEPGQEYEEDSMVMFVGITHVCALFHRFHRGKPSL